MASEPTHPGDPPTQTDAEEQTSPALVVQVTVVHGPSSGQVHRVDRFPAILGRGREADVHVDDDSQPTKVSRQHARIRLYAGCIQVEDISTNGTWVDGEFVGPGRTVDVREGALVQLGPHAAVRLEVVRDVPTVPAAPPTAPQQASPVVSWLRNLAQPLLGTPKREGGHVVEVRTLGAFRVVVNGVPLPENSWQYRKAVTLLVYLVDTGQPAPADRLWEALWPDAADGRQAVQTAVSRIRRAVRAVSAEAGLPDLVRSENKLYGLEPGCTPWYDVREFEAWTQEAQRAWQSRDLEATGKALECAFELYRGPFLRGFSEDWVAGRRTYLERCHFEALETLGALREEEKRPVDAARVYQGVIDADPCREQAHLGLIRSLASQGRRDDAVRQWTRSVTTLRKMLNLPPSPEMEALYRALTDGG